MSITPEAPHGQLLTHGRLVAVDGLDGTGKTPLSRRLAERLGAHWTTTPPPGFGSLCEATEAALGHDPLALEALYTGTVLGDSSGDP